jgi:hypothetical protein
MTDRAARLRQQLLCSSSSLEVDKTRSKNGSGTALFVSGRTHDGAAVETSSILRQSAGHSNIEYRYSLWAAAAINPLSGDPK